MHQRDWLKDENCPSDATRVWIAVEPVQGGNPVTYIGFKNFDGKWYFELSGKVSDAGMHVLGWYPVRIPPYIKN